MSYNKYPTVMIHGLGGWGDSDLMNKFWPYWGFGKNNLANYLKKEGYEIYLPSLGPVNSAWDRACIMWAYLFGGTVDFGKAHSEKYHTERYGHTYEHGVLEDLGKTEAHKKVNFIGHSFGGPTVKMINQLFLEGSEEERAVTPPEELSPLFAGGHGNLIHTITTLDGDNNGTTVCDWAEDGKHLLVLLNKLLAGFIVFAGETRLMKLYGMHAEQWGLMPDTATLTKYKFNNPFKHLDVIRNFANPDYVENNIMHEMRVEVVEEIINPKQHTDDGIYYFCMRADTLVPKEGITNKPHRHMFPFAYLAGLVTGSYAPDFLKKYGVGTDPDWFRGDGFVNLTAQGGPLNAECEDGVFGETDFKPGIWYNMPPAHADHLWWMGVTKSEDDRQELFKTMFEQYRNLPDA